MEDELTLEMQAVLAAIIGAVVMIWCVVKIVKSFSEAFTNRSMYTNPDEPPNHAEKLAAVEHAFFEPMSLEEMDE